MGHENPCIYDYRRMRGAQFTTDCFIDRRMDCCYHWFTQWSIVTHDDGRFWLSIGSSNLPLHKPIVWRILQLRQSKFGLQLRRNEQGTWRINGRCTYHHGKHGGTGESIGGLALLSWPGMDASGVTGAALLLLNRNSQCETQRESDDPCNQHSQPGLATRQDRTRQYSTIQYSSGRRAHCRHGAALWHLCVHVCRKKQRKI